MKIALFVPCYVDQFYPQAAIATLKLLEKLGCQVEYPMEQTCCGQPMANAGCVGDAIPAYWHFTEVFEKYDYIVAPSGSCVYHVRKHYDAIEQTEAVRRVRKRTLELSEFLLDVLKIRQLEAYFPHQTGLLQTCHGLRGLRLGRGSERTGEDFSKTKTLLDMVKGIEIVETDRPDECCGFGGTFAIGEPAVSVKMGRDRIDDFLRHGVEVVTAADMSCLMHLEGIIRRRGLPLRVMHFAEILNSH